MNSSIPSAMPYDFPELALAQGMSDQQRGLFFNGFARTRKDTSTGVLLAIILGGFGAHRFYLDEIGWGVVYLLFSWSGIPMVVGLVEAFFMPDRVRVFNFVQAQMLAAQIRTGGAF